jgi:hypothetical protein
VTTEQDRAVAGSKRSSGFSWLLGAGGVLVLGAAIGLWGRHGAAVFFDMVAAGVAYCF